MNYIGVDCHISSLDFAVVNERGTITQKAKVNTGVKEFMAFVKSIPKPRKIFMNGVKSAVDPRREKSYLIQHVTYTQNRISRSMVSCNEPYSINKSQRQT